MRLILKPDWDPNNPYYINGLKIVIPVGGYLPDYNYYPEQREWLKNWYSNRDQQVNENFSGIRLGTKGFNINRNIPLQYVENSIDVAMKTPVRYKSLSNYSDNTRGGYSLGDRKITIDPNKENTDSAMIHERTHAFNHSLRRNIYTKHYYPLSPIEYKVEDIMSKWYNKNAVDEYWDSPNEIYARLMEMRYRLGLDPKKKVTLDDIKKWREDKVLKQYEMGVYDDDTLIKLFNEVADNTKLNEEINYVKRGSKLINKCQNGERVNMSRLVTNSEGTPLKVDNNLLEELDNFLIKQNVGLPLRLAILYTVVQEGSTTGSHGNGAYGYLGWRGSRIPAKVVNLMLYLYDTIFGEFNKDLWNHGGVGSGYKTAREAQQSFINATNVNDALRSLNYGYVRPELELREFRSKTKYFNEDEEVN